MYSCLRVGHTVDKFLSVGLTTFGPRRWLGLFSWHIMTANLGKPLLLCFTTKLDFPFEAQQVLLIAVGNEQSLAWPNGA